MACPVAPGASRDIHDSADSEMTGWPVLPAQWLRLDRTNASESGNKPTEVGGPCRVASGASAAPLATPLEPEWPSGILSATVFDRGTSVSTGFPASVGGRDPAAPGERPLTARPTS